MYTFLATCTDRDGRDVVERVEAGSLKHARELLEQRGFTNIVFETDAELYTEKSRFDFSAPLPPGQALANHRSGTVPWSLWLRTWAQNLAPFALWNAVSWWQGAPYGSLDWMGFALTGCVLVAAFLLGLPLHLYECLLAASAWSRWKQVLRLAPILAAIGRLLGLRTLQADARFRRARALIGTDRSAEAFASVADLQRPDTDLSRQADLRWAAGQRDAAIALRRRVTEHAPDKADGWIDLAVTLMRAGDVAGARIALDRGRACEITALARCWIDFAEGTLSLAEGHAARAVELLAKAIDDFAALASNPLADACRLWWKGWLVLALAAAGRREEARRTFAECRALLQVTAEERDLLARCERAVA